MKTLVVVSVFILFANMALPSFINTLHAESERTTAINMAVASIK